MVARLEEAQNAAVRETGDAQECVSAEHDGAEFESLLGDFSAALIRVPVAEIDHELERWLARIVVAMELDRGNILQVDAADGVLYHTHQWGREGVATPERGLRVRANADEYPWLAAQILSDKM